MADFDAADADGVDFSYGRPSIPAMVAAGIRLAGRYMSPPPNGKNLTAGEAAQLRAAGIAPLLGWESDAGRPLLGASAGYEDGQAAAAYAESIGAPHGLTIYYACDRDTGPAQWPAVAAYFQAAGLATLGRYLVGVYGEADVIDYLYDHGAATSCWQTYAWSGGRLSANADVYQYSNNVPFAGANVDLNRIIREDRLGAWWPDGYVPEGGGTPITPEEEVEYMLPEYIRNAATGAVISHLGGGVLKAVAPSTFSTWVNLQRDVTNLDVGPWTDYVASLDNGHPNNVAAVAMAHSDPATEVGAAMVIRA